MVPTLEDSGTHLCHSGFGDLNNLSSPHWLFRLGKQNVLSLSELKRVQSLIYPAKVLFQLSVSNPIKKLRLKVAMHFPLSQGYLNPIPLEEFLRTAQIKLQPATLSKEAHNF